MPSRQLNSICRSGPNTLHRGMIPNICDSSIDHLEYLYSAARLSGRIVFEVVIDPGAVGWLTIVCGPWLGAALIGGGNKSTVAHLNDILKKRLHCSSNRRNTRYLLLVRNFDHLRRLVPRNRIIAELTDEFKIALVPNLLRVTSDYLVCCQRHIYIHLILACRQCPREQFPLALPHHRKFQ